MDLALNTQFLCSSGVACLLSLAQKLALTFLAVVFLLYLLRSLALLVFLWLLLEEITLSLRSSCSTNHQRNTRPQPGQPSHPKPPLEQRNGAADAPVDAPNTEQPPQPQSASLDELCQPPASSLHGFQSSFHRSRPAVDCDESQISAYAADERQSLPGIEAASAVDGAEWITSCESVAHVERRADGDDDAWAWYRAEFEEVAQFAIAEL